MTKSLTHFIKINPAVSNDITDEIRGGRVSNKNQIVFGINKVQNCRQIQRAPQICICMQLKYNTENI